MGNIRLLRADEIDARIQSVNKGGARVLLYKNARTDMDILDETFGPMNWQRKHELINGRLFCSVGVYDSHTDQWVWKQDVGVESNTEKEKGQASDAFKRACVNFGIGRELYTAPDIFFFNKDLKNYKAEGNRYSCYDRFTVVDIEYSGRVISHVKIKNESTGKVHTFSNAARPAKDKGEQEMSVDDGLNGSQTQTIINFAARKGKSVEQMLEMAGVKDVNQLTRNHYNKIITLLRDE